MARATGAEVQKQLNRLLAGMVAGLAATGVMSLVMLGAKLVGALGEPPPRRLTRRLLSPLGARPRGRALDAVALLAHAGYGACVGGAFALLPGRFKTQGGGRLFGLGVWALNYCGVLPQFGLMPPARKDRFGRPSSMIAAHLAYGTALAAIERELYPVSADLGGKVVVVCGGSRGLGRALAAELARRGARVAICGRAPEPVERAQRWLEGFGSPVLADVCDLRDDGQTRTFLRRVERELGPIDVLIANAATIDVGPVEALRPSDFNATMSEIFGSAMNATLTVLPAMRARGQGTIAIISSIGGKLGIPHLAAYSSAKFAQVGFAEALGAEVAKDGVRVLTVAPGLMRTGSHVHATFRGQPERELIWFGASAIAPLVSIDAGRAARHIVRAIARGERYLTFTPAAHVGTWLHDAAPNVWALIASMAGRLLPNARGSETSLIGYEGTEVIKNSSSPLVRWIAGGSEPLATKYGQ
jgi:NAD(P)-dependent dehydrogenase (short-subunit alcohol dehydrogenase family)